MPCILCLAKLFLQTLHLRLARLCLASCALQDCALQALHLAPCKAVPCTLRLAGLCLAPCALQGCALQACKPCTLQALKALFWGGSYFTLLFTQSGCFVILFGINNNRIKKGKFILKNIGKVRFLQIEDSSFFCGIS